METGCAGLFPAGGRATLKEFDPVQRVRRYQVSFPVGGRSTLKVVELLGSGEDRCSFIPGL